MSAAWMRQVTYKHYVLAALTVISVFSILDRLALGLLVEGIKADLHLSDTQLGLLGGIAFAAFHAIMGIPIARWADRGNRVTIISLCMALWTAAVALCGTATTFMQLLLTRMVAAVGEAGFHPPAISLIADYFTRAERPRATAIFALSAPLAIAAGFVGAGWLNELYGWRLTFMILGLAGLPLSAVAWFTLREPRNSKPTLKAVPVAQPSMKDVTSTLWGNATFRHLLLCICVLAFFNSGVVMWQPAFLMRTHGLDTQEAGLWLTVTWGVGCLVGMLLGGELASRYAASNERLQLKALAISIMCSGVFATCSYIAPNPFWAFVLMGLAVVAKSAQAGPLSSAIQTLVPPRMRAVSFAFVNLFSSLIGLGFGPLAAGALSDAFQSWAGEHSLRYALLCLSPGYFWVAWHAWRASTTVGRDLASIPSDHEVPSPEKDAEVSAPREHPGGLRAGDRATVA